MGTKKDDFTTYSGSSSEITFDQIIGFGACTFPAEVYWILIRKLRKKYFKCYVKIQHN